VNIDPDDPVKRKEQNLGNQEKKVNEEPESGKEK